MWLPRTTQELLRALDWISETASVEFKEALPVRSKNNDIATDVAAMSTDGGVIIYGVAEDKSAGTFSPKPFELAHQRERIVSIVESRVGGSPYIETFAMEETDIPGSGYIVVHVPASPTAPHLVEGSGFWGRNDQGNKRLTQGDVDRLYKRREGWETSSAQLIDEARSACSYVAGSDKTLGVYHLVVQPVIAPKSVRETALQGDNAVPLFQMLSQVSNGLDFDSLSDFKLEALLHSVTRKTYEGIRLVESPGANEFVQMELEVRDDGGLRFDLGTALHLDPSNGSRVVFDVAISQCTALILAVAGRIYSLANYHGLVNVAATIDNGEGAISATWMSPNVWNSPTSPKGSLPSVDPLMTLQCSAADLSGQNVLATSDSLLHQLLRVLRPAVWRSPFDVGRNTLS